MLYRTNAQSGALESAFTKARIPYRVFGGLRFYERKEIKDIVAYLSLIANPADDMRLTRIINVPKRAIGTATVENVARIAAAEGAPMLEIVRNASDYPALLKASLKLERFYALIADLADFAAEHSLSALVEEVLARTGYLDMLRSSPEDRDKEEIVQEFVSTAKLFEETDDSAGLSAFLEDIALVSDTDTYDENAEAVSLMTVHSAKGLEFPYVFLPGFEDGLFPSSRALDNRESEEEERRLAYVAITRAKKALTILYTKSPRHLRADGVLHALAFSGRDSRRPSGKGDGQTPPRRHQPPAGAGHRAPQLDLRQRARTQHAVHRGRQQGPASRFRGGRRRRVAGYGQRYAAGGGILQRPDEKADAELRKIKAEINAKKR